MPKPLTELQCRVLRLLLDVGPLTAKAVAHRLFGDDHIAADYRSVIGALRSLDNLCLVNGWPEYSRANRWRVPDCYAARARAALDKYEAAKETTNEH